MPAASSAAMDTDAAPLAAASSKELPPAGWLESGLTNELTRQGVGDPTHPILPVRQGNTIQKDPLSPEERSRSLSRSPHKSAIRALGLFEKQKEPKSRAKSKGSLSYDRPGYVSHSRSKSTEVKARYKGRTVSKGNTIKLDSFERGYDQT